MSQTSSVRLKREELLAPSAQFKKEAAKSIIAIIGFITVYLLLFALSLGLVGLCLYGGFLIIMLKPSFYTILIGGGIVGCGIMIFVFLIKFIFSSSRAGDEDSIELKQEDQPELFEMIYELARETGTAKPKKIYLSADVNAAVFYNSSFWSMFFPIKKNLKIGLGLVNVLNVSELKAVIAHEFGHFSQRSMKVGSWVYGVNKIIHDMLYNNTGYANSLTSIASVHGIIDFFVRITIKIVQGIQWVLHQMFKVVNKSYMGLSRQMEFHADTVAASVCGSNNIISALKRSEFAEACYSTALDVCNKAWKEKKVVNDFYTAHQAVIKNIAHLNQMQLVNGLPVLKDDESSEISNRVNYKDQWASHPTLQERKDYLEPFNLNADVNTAPAWTLFTNEENLKQTLTKQLYKSIPSDEIKGSVDSLQFEALFTEKLQEFSYPARFKEFYRGRIITSFDPDILIQTPFSLKPYEEIMTREAISLPKRLQYLEQDIAVLQAIINKQIITSSFDFDGKKHPARQATEVLALLEAERENHQRSLELLDQQLFLYFYAALPLPEAEQFKKAYSYYFNQRKKSDDFAETANKMMESLAPLYNGERLGIEAIQTMISNLKEQHEKNFKKELQEWLSAGAFSKDIALKSEVEKFINSDYQYFSGDSFFDNELIELNSVVQDSWDGISDYVFGLFKNITEQQAQILEKGKEEVLTQ